MNIEVVGHLDGDADLDNLAMVRFGGVPASAGVLDSHRHR